VPFDWTRLNDIFHRALEVPAAERAGFLDEACEGDSELRAEVASLLHAHDQAGEFIEQPVLSAADLIAQTDGENLVGRTIGQYLIRRVLGEGGMGIVYLADDTRLGRPVALNALAPNFTRDPGRRERLTREARAAAALTHPGIATVYALEEFDDQLYICSEYVPGETLREELRRGPVPVARVIDTALGIVRALATAHERGIVHRDLKPENLIRTPGGDLKILDFGLARFRDVVPGGAMLTGDGAVLGTPAYMSPEQIRGDAVDFRSDLFAIGIILYELATGVHPFLGSDSASTIARILETEPRRLREFAPMLGPAGSSLSLLESIVTTCLQKSPGARYRSTDELIVALERTRDATSGMRPAAASWPPAGGETGDRDAGRSGPRWWWEFHQVAASVAYVTLLAPLWLARLTMASRTGMLLFVAGLAAVITASTLRLHLVFTVRSYPAEREQQQRSTRHWIRGSDALFGLSMVVAGFSVLDQHASIALTLISASIAIVISTTVIEPATTRAAFGNS